MKSSLQLRKTMVTAMLMMIIALLAVTSATFAWYIYNTNAHTTEVQIAAGSTGDLQISLSKDTGYSSTVALSSHGTFVPVSTNDVSKGFQQVSDYETTTKSGVGGVFASIFKSANPNVEYYKTTLYIKAGSTGSLYTNVSYSEASKDNLLSTALRLAYVVKESGKSDQQYIFELNTTKNAIRYNNTKSIEGKSTASSYVLDSSKTDGSTVAFTALTPDNFCNYDSATQTASKKTNSKSIGTVSATPLQVDVYLWLEGCDEDCVTAVSGAKLENLCLYFFTL